MRRTNRHKIKTEHPESSSYSRDHDEHDLAYYIHDRVELMHQVFSVLKYKEIKAMAPECVRNLAVGDLQELCTEELLGISSKRLLATLDGAEPPSDTESSSRSPSPDPMETISLDSISSDEEILSQSSKKKKHKHKRNSKSKKKREKSKPEAPEATTATRAGLTVLELLELQARARAIRAQLQNEQRKKQSEVSVEANSHTDDDEVEIKEEAPEVVEISSGDEKPDITVLQLEAQKTKELPKQKDPQAPKEISKSKEPVNSKELDKSKNSQQPREPEKTNVDKETPAKTITKKSNDLIITVPQAKTTRKIKLNRNKVTVTVPNIADTTQVENRIVTIAQKSDETPKDVDKTKKKQKKNKKKKRLEKEGSDHDEITLQLSDSEKMDLLEDLNEKNYDKLSSDSESSSSDSEEDTTHAQTEHTEATDVETKIEDSVISGIEVNESEKGSNEPDLNAAEDNVQNAVQELPAIDISESHAEKSDSIKTSDLEDQNSNVEIEVEKVTEENTIENRDNNEEITDTDNNNVLDTNQAETQTDEKTDGIVDNVDEATITDDGISKESIDEKVVTVTETQEVSESKVLCEEPSSNEMEIDKVVKITKTNNEERPSDNQDNLDQKMESESEGNEKKLLSDGELSDRESSGVEAVDMEPEVVCISDDEKQKKKKKKKDKKAKKEKKSKKSKQDFRESGDQNFYKETEKPIHPDPVEIADNTIDKDNTIDVTDDDVYEILELSDDSSCYEVEGTILSKEPTAEEIQALSDRIDMINSEEIVINDDIDIEKTPTETDNSEHTNPEDESEQETHMSWKDRYLDSKKVKKVLTASNILNALRKKNKELKRKIDESKKKETEAVVKETVEEKVLEEGSIEHYQTLPAGSKYVDVETKSVEENETTEDKTEVVTKEVVTKEMKKDAKQLLKMFKKLMNSRKEKRREKKKKRKQKKQLNSGEVIETNQSNINA